MLTMNNVCPRSGCDQQRSKSYCPEHEREYKREYVRRPEVRARAAEGARQRYLADPQKFIDRTGEWKKRHVERVALTRGAMGYVAWAIGTGLLVKPSRCEQCQDESRIEAAHADYSQPLVVRWLCRRCHRRWDRETPKSMPVVAMRAF